MRNIKLTIAYDGTNYHGYQEQRGTGYITVQEVLENALFKLSGSSIQLHGSSRTDAGVHAKGQVVNFDCSDWPIPTERIVRALNSVLPYDVVALKAEDVPRDFHARFSSTGKKYSYVIYNDIVPSPFEACYSYFLPRELNVDMMQKAAEKMTGTHDFRAFKASNSTVKSNVRTVYSCAVKSYGKKITFIVQGNGFLYNMVRIMAGTLIEVGIGKLSPGSIPTVIDSRDRTQAGPTAPAHGLFLEEVFF